MSGNSYEFDVFVSYSHKDKTPVAKLIERLRVDGLRVWVDEEQIGGGDPLRDAMVEGIMQSAHVICCLSPDYLRSKWTTFESAVNQAMDPDNQKRRLIPVQIAPVEIPPAYRWLYCPDLANPATWEKEYQKTAKSIRKVEPTASSSFPSVRTMLPASPSRSFQALGFEYDPFAYPEVERIPDDILQEIFFPHPEFVQVLDLNRSAVLLAPRGGGKSTFRRLLEIDLNKRRQEAFLGRQLGSHQLHAPFVVTYRRFENVVEHLPSVRPSHHTKSLLIAIAEAFVSFLEEGDNQFMTLDMRMRDWWWSLLENFLEVDDLSVRLSPTLVLDKQRLATRTNPFRSEASLSEILERVVRYLAPLGLDGVYVLVDGVDGHAGTGDPVSATKLIEPLLNELTVLSIPSVFWKFFLPNFVLDALLSSSGYQTGRVELVHVTWTVEDLQELLRLRLEWASGGYVRELAMLCTLTMLN